MNPAIDAAYHAAQRAAAMAHLDLAQRIRSLAAIATLAPLFGVLGTAIAILTYVFQPPIGGDTPSSTLGHVAER